MDLITTGVSASERSRRANLLAALRQLIAEKLPPGSSTVKVNQVINNFCLPHRVILAPAVLLLYLLYSFYWYAERM